MQWTKSNLGPAQLASAAAEPGTMDSLDMASEEEDEVTAGVEEVSLNSGRGRAEDEATDEAET